MYVKRFAEFERKLKDSNQQTHIQTKYTREPYSHTQIQIHTHTNTHQNPTTDTTKKLIENGMRWLAENKIGYLFLCLYYYKLNNKQRKKRNSKTKKIIRIYMYAYFSVKKFGEISHVDWWNHRFTVDYATCSHSSHPQHDVQQRLPPPNWALRFLW